MDKGRLLVLDDEPDVGTTLCAMAVAAGLEARSCTSAGEFFALQASWRPTHIALDLMMPDIDGIEVIHQLARQNCRAAVIITSGAGARVVEAAQRGSIEHGLNVLGVLPKPFLPRDLRALLGQAQPRARPASSAIRSAPAADVDESALRDALRDSQFDGRIHLNYQPKISCRDGRVAGFEALVRWRHPALGMIPPDVFVPLAERGDLIHPLTDHVLCLAFGWLAAFGDDADFVLSVNLSARLLGDMKFANHVFAICWDHGIDPSRVILEVTETSAMTDPLTTLDLLTRLRIKGFQLSIDDFGVGYSSMVQLARLPFSELKIDKSFVHNLATSSDSQKIVRGIIGLGHSLGMRVTAEGVEDQAALDFLCAERCDLAQGFLIGRPVPAAEVAARLAHPPFAVRRPTG